MTAVLGPTVVWSTVSIGGGSTAIGSAAGRPAARRGIEDRHLRGARSQSRSPERPREAGSTLSATVGASTPFQRTTEKALKPVPVSTSVSGTPARAVGGVTDASVGAGFVIDVSEASALKIWTRGTVVVPAPQTACR